MSDVRILLRSLACSCACIASQALAAPQGSQHKPSLDARAAESWKRGAGFSTTLDGEWAAAQFRPFEGDTELTVVHRSGEPRYVFPRARSPRFSSDGRYCIFLVPEAWAAARKRKLAELRAKEKAGASPRASGSKRGGASRKAVGRGKGPSKTKTGRNSKQSSKKGPSKSSKKSRNRAPDPELWILDLRSGKTKVLKGVKSFSTPTEGPPLVVLQLAKPGEQTSSSSSPSSGRRRMPGSRRGGRFGRRGSSGGSGGSGPLEIWKLDPIEKVASLRAVDRWRLSPKTGQLFFTRMPKPAVKKAAAGKPRGQTRTGRRARKQGAAAKGASRGEAAATQLKKQGAASAQGRKKKPARGPLGIFVRTLGSGKTVELFRGPCAFQGPWFDREEQRFVYFFQERTGKESRKAVEELNRTRSYQLHGWRPGRSTAEVLVRPDALPQGLLFQTRYSPSFRRDGEALLLGVAKPAPKKLPPQLPEDKVRLDIWHFEDPLLQSQQAKVAAMASRRARGAVYRFADASFRIVQEEKENRLRWLSKDSPLLLEQDSRPYRKRISWDGSYADYYVVDSRSGERRRLLREIRGTVSPSSGGKWLVHLGSDKAWWATNVATSKQRSLTAGLKVAFTNELWDQPAPARAYGIMGWTEDDREVLIYDRFDIWRVDPLTGIKRCQTKGEGRKRGFRFRYVRTDPDLIAVPSSSPILFSVFDEKTKRSGYARGALDSDAAPEILTLEDCAYGRMLTKAKKADRYFFTKSRFDVFPDYWCSGPSFRDAKRLTDANPQQSKYRWGKAELVHWRSASGQALDGILVKPDGFDPKRKYPMMVYFYERSSSRLHSYSTPHPGTSPAASYYVSQGYLWFVPDIAYRIGYPGQSCLQCLVPGVLELIKRGYVDEKAIGVAGHSWGGYQTAYLVTQTNLFAAAESGAPVSNMTSAYGGIRWGTGMSRMFQYEKTQSRIGGTLWEKPLRYIENSPIFFVDKVRTPLLILHNDKDGAVPWYQGIEYFTALRRLGREAYFFNYNGEGHGLSRAANKRDWARRMEEFFASKLLGTPKAKWMREGVPYLEREREKVQVPSTHGSGPAAGGPGTRTKARTRVR